MNAGRIIAIIVGAVLGLIALALMIGGTILGIAYAIEREGDGYFDATFRRLASPTAAITTEEADLREEPPGWFLEFVDFSVRIKATNSNPDDPVFVGIGPESDVEAYLQTVARDEIIDISPGRDPKYRTVVGTGTAEPPGTQEFWVASAQGPGTQQMTWEFTEGSWIAVLMNADGSPGILADVTVGVRSGALQAVALGMLIIGLLILILAVVIVVLAVRDYPAEPEAEAEEAAAALPQPARLEAELDTPLSRWLWLVKWFLAIPHFIVLAFLYIAFAILSFIAFFAILFTKRYPRGMFNFNVGVLRWTWRVMYYCATGGLGTDRYPPFSTDPDPDYPAHFDVEYPGELSRGLVLVKWWLLALPHYIILGIIAGGGASFWGRYEFAYSGGLLGLLVFFAAVALLFTGRYPRGSLTSSSGSIAGCSG